MTRQPLHFTAQEAATKTFAVVKAQNPGASLTVIRDKSRHYLRRMIESGLFVITDAR